MPELLQLARTFPEPHLRQTAAVLLRKSLDASVWPAIGAPGQTSIKAGLLEGVVAETQDPKTRRALADTISKLAGIASASGGWADLLPFVFKLAIDTDGANKKLGFEILASLSIEVGGDAIVPLLEPLQPVLGAALCAPNALAVRVACLNAVESMVEHVKDKEHRAHQQALQAHLPACLAVLQEALASGDMTHAKECLTSFIAIAESDASFLRPHVDSMLSVAFGVAGADLDENVRHLGLELRLVRHHVEPRQDQVGVLAEQLVRLERVVLADDVLHQDPRLRLFVVLEQHRHLPLLLLREVGLLLLGGACLLWASSDSLLDVVASKQPHTEAYRWIIKGSPPTAADFGGFLDFPDFFYVSENVDF